MAKWPQPTNFPAVEQQIMRGVVNHDRSLLGQMDGVLQDFVKQVMKDMDRLLAEVPGLKEALGEGGWSFRVGDSDALANRLGLVIRNPGEVTSRRGCMFPVPDFQKHLGELEDIYGELNG